MINKQINWLEQEAVVEQSFLMTKFLNNNTNFMVAYMNQKILI